MLAIKWKTVTARLSQSSKPCLSQCAPAAHIYLVSIVARKRFSSQNALQCERLGHGFDDWTVWCGRMNREFWIYTADHLLAQNELKLTNISKIIRRMPYKN